MARLASPRVFLLRKRAQRGGQPHSPAVRGAQRHSLRGNVGIKLKSVCVVSGISPPHAFFPRISIATPVCESGTGLEAGESGCHCYCVCPLPGAPG